MYVYFGGKTCVWSGVASEVADAGGRERETLTDQSARSIGT